MAYQEQLKKLPATPVPDLLLPSYLELLSLVERLHRLLLDVVKDEFERLGLLDINSVQALLLFNVGTHEVTAGELKTRGYYQGSNVSYNLKKLVESGYMNHQRSEIDRRAVRVRLTEKGQKIQNIVANLFEKHASTMLRRNLTGDLDLSDINLVLKRMERYWTEEIRYIY
jgi:DNA-binding MarR family transcriptional regulator